MVPQDYFTLMTPEMAHKIIFYGKLAAAIGAISAVLYQPLRWLRSAVNKISDTHENVSSMMINHLPHLQEAIDSHGESLQTIKSDVRDLDTRMVGIDQRLNDTKASVHTLGDKFVQHLETSAKELVEARAAEVKNEVDIAAIKAAQKVLEDASQAAGHLVDTTRKRRKE